MIGGNIYSRYLPVEPSLVDWGFYVLSSGFSAVKAGESYPVGEHPDDYNFSWDKGRDLREYQIVYITKGKGIFEWASGEKQNVSAGDLFLLYPGEWHRYSPLKETGWDECWIGFNGDYAKQLMDRFFSKEHPILKVGHDDELLKKMQFVLQLMKEAPAGYRQMMAGETVAALARIRSLNMRSHNKTRQHEEKMNEARYYLLQHAAEEVDLEELATDLGFSYSRFRTIFKRHTGQSPLQYQLDIRVNRAKDLLKDSSKSISEIADELGFGSVYYFSRLFKQRTGMAPTAYRAK